MDKQDTIKIKTRELQSGDVICLKSGDFQVTQVIKFGLGVKVTVKLDTGKWLEFDADKVLNVRC